MHSKECRWFAAPHSWLPSCLHCSAHGTMESFSSSKAFPSALSAREHSSALSAWRCGCSTRPKAEQKSVLKGSNHPTVPLVSIPDLLILVGIFPVNVLRLRMGRLVCPTPETPMLPGTPPWEVHGICWLQGSIWPCFIQSQNHVCWKRPLRSLSQKTT